VRGWLERHAELTGSARAVAILADWPSYAPRFARIGPKDAATPDRPIPVNLPARIPQPATSAVAASTRTFASGD
jgi:hypothetical protein